jgi:FG-GAP repeat
MKTRKFSSSVAALAIFFVGLVVGSSTGGASTAASAGNVARVDSSAPTMQETLRTEYYRAVARDLADRNQFNRGLGSVLPDASHLPWTNSAAWLEQMVAADDGQANDLFGFRILLNGDTAFISAPAPIYRPGSVYVFKNVNGTWTQTQKLVAQPDVTPPPNWSDFFGWSLAVSGNTLLVGAPFTFDVQGPTGAAFVFTESNGTWQQAAQLKASDAVAIDYFGQAVGLVDNTAVVGAYNKNGGEGAAYVFTNAGSAWNQTQEIFASDGLPGDSHQFGEALAFNGRILILGAPGPDYVSTGVYPQGAAYVFSETSGTWNQVQKLTAADGAPGDQFGFAIDLTRRRALIGAPAANVGANPHQGAAYLITDARGGIWSQTEKLVASDGVAYDQFGQSVALRANAAVVGEWSHDDDPTHTPPPPKQGVSYLFRRSNDLLMQSGELTASDGEPGDSFGWDVDLDQGAILIGAQGTVGGNMYQGAAYFYTRPGN